MRKFKKIVIMLLVAVMTLLSTTFAEARLPLCVHCNQKVARTWFQCGGINLEQTDYYINNGSHNSNCMPNCTTRVRRGYTVYHCSSGCVVHEGYHECHITYHGYLHYYSETEMEYFAASEVVEVCPYGGYPR